MNNLGASRRDPSLGLDASFRAGGRENAPAQGRWRFDRLGYEGESGGGLSEPDEICLTALALGDMQLE